MLKFNGVIFFLRLISICDKIENELIFLYVVVGEGIKEFVKFRENDEISFIGFFGNGFDLEKDYGCVVLVCGGIGIVFMFEFVKRLKNKNEE